MPAYFDARAIAVGLLVGLALGSVLMTAKDDARCREWQSAYADAYDASEEGRGGILELVNIGPMGERLRELRRERPEGCRFPPGTEP